MNSMAIVRRQNVWLPGGLLLVLLPHFTRLPLSITLFCVALFGVRLLSDLGRLRLPPAWLRLALVGLGVLLVLQAYHTLLGRQAGVSLLAIMLGLKLLEMKSTRDTVVTIFLGYFIVIAGFLFDQSLLIGAYMFVVVSVLTAGWVALQSQASPEVTPLRQGKLAVTLLAQALPIAALLFLLFPRIPGPLWGLPEDAFASTGLSDSMSPGLITELAIDDSAAFRVQFDGPAPPPADLYWRGLVFWRFDGRTWSTPEGPEFLPREPAIVPVGRPIEYSVLLEPHDRRWLLALDLAAAAPNQTSFTGAHQLQSDRPVTRLQQYRLRSYLDYRLQAEQIPDPRRYLQVPAAYAPRARELARQWRNAATDAEDVVRQGLAYLRNEPFFYTLSAPLLLDDPVDDFLFQTRRGYCEHFASSFAVLMRLAGVPSRIVTGYQGGEANPIGNYWLVRQADAHAWVEVWLEARGWVRIDPTAVIPAERVEVSRTLARDLDRAAGREGFDVVWTGALMDRLRFSWDSLNHHWKQWVVSYNQERQQALLEKLGLDKTRWTQLIGLLVISLSAAAAVIAFMVLRTRARRQDPARRLYDRFCARLGRRGLRRDPAEAPLQYAERVAQDRPDIAFQVWRITRLYTRVRYAAHNRIDQLLALRLAVRRFRP